MTHSLSPQCCTLAVASATKYSFYYLLVLRPDLQLSIFFIDTQNIYRLQITLKLNITDVLELAFVWLVVILARKATVHTYAGSLSVTFTSLIASPRKQIMPAKNHPCTLTKRFRTYWRVQCLSLLNFLSK
jgi:hypothetical protein